RGRQRAGPAEGAARRARRVAGAAPAGRGGGGGDLREPQRRGHPEARLRARRGAARTRAGRHPGARIRRQVGEDGGGRHWRGGQGAGAGDGAPAAAGGGVAPGGRGGRAGGGDLPCPPSVQPARLVDPRRRHRDAVGVIAKLTGRIDALEDGRCVLDVNGVGYLVHASARTLAALPSPPALAQLLIETQVREDAITLFGFSDAAERDWFRLLTTVQGVGARVALGILSALSPRELVGAIAAGDRASLTRAPGVGAKLAIRLLTELREKAGAMPVAAGIPAMPRAPAGVAE